MRVSINLMIINSINLSNPNPNINILWDPIVTIITSSNLRAMISHTNHSDTTIRCSISSTDVRHSNNNTTPQRRSTTSVPSEGAQGLQGP